MKTEPLYAKYGGRKARWVIELGSDGKWRFYCLPRKPGASSVFGWPNPNREACLTELRRLFQAMV